ncbi:hypothetical protein L1O48_09690 [Ligilactobacillus equi]|uniref:hypothetical protein n=1 Tax=Ligilactobacillus equi TaxID=137357 RepID=UPI002ED04B09
MSYIKLDLADDSLYIPGAGFHIYGQGSFLADGAIFEEMKAKFPWIRKVLQVKVTALEQKI